MKCNLLLLKLDGTCRSNLINNTQLKFPNTNISCSNAPSFDDSKIYIYKNRKAYTYKYRAVATSPAGPVLAGPFSILI